MRTPQSVGLRPRVALIGLSFGEYPFRLASALAERADVLFITPADLLEEFGRFLHDRVEVHAPPLPRLRQPLAQIRYQLRLVRAVRRFAPDVVHVQHGHLWLNPALVLLRRLPLVITIHDPRAHSGDAASRKTPQWIYDAGFRRADAIIVLVPRMIEPVTAEIGVRRDRIRVVPHPAVGDADLDVDVDEDPHTVLWFGRLWPYKGLDVLIRAQPKVTAEIPDARFVVAGEGESFERYRRMMVDPDVFEVYNIRVPGELAARLFRRSAVVALPYLDATQSGVVTTAYAYAKPVVASDVGGLADQVDDGTTGLLVPPGDEGALAAALVRLLGDEDERRRMGQAAQHKLDTEWSAATVADRTLDVYQEVLQRQPDRRRR